MCVRVCVCVCVCVCVSLFVYVSPHSAKLIAPGCSEHSYCLDSKIPQKNIVSVRNVSK